MFPSIPSLKWDKIVRKAQVENHYCHLHPCWKTDGKKYDCFNSKIRRSYLEKWLFIESKFEFTMSKLDVFKKKSGIFCKIEKDLIWLTSFMKRKSLELHNILISLKLRNLCEVHPIQDLFWKKVDNVWNYQKIWILDQAKFFLFFFVRGKRFLWERSWTIFVSSGSWNFFELSPSKKINPFYFHEG